LRCWRIGTTVTGMSSTRPHAWRRCRTPSIPCQQGAGLRQPGLALEAARSQPRNEPLLNYLGDSDAHIVRGLIAILLTLLSGHTPQQILATDAIAVFDEFGFREHLTPQRSNGLRAMVERIRSDAREALAAASS